MQFGVDVSSRKRCCVGSHASQSNLRAAEEPKVARSRVDHPVGQADEREHLLLEREQMRSCSAAASSTRAYEHLDLVELVHADDAAGVLAVRAGLAAVARAPARVAQRAARQVDDLVRVVARERHLGRADGVLVVSLEAVDLVRVRTEEPRAAHDPG